MVLTSTFNLTFPVETLQLLQPTTNTVIVNLPNITNDTQMGTEILFYKTATGTQDINIATGSTNLILGTNQETSTTYTMSTNNLKFVACKWTTGVYAWAIISSSIIRSGKVTFPITNYIQSNFVTFPIPFITAPIVTTSFFIADASMTYHTMISSVTNTGFTVFTNVSNLTPNVTNTIYWIAL